MSDTPQQTQDERHTLASSVNNSPQFRLKIISAGDVVFDHPCPEDANCQLVAAKVLEALPGLARFGRVAVLLVGPDNVTTLVGTLAGHDVRRGAQCSIRPKP